MSSRQETNEQVNAMQGDIRRMVQEQAFSTRRMLPPVRELALKYGISHGLAGQVLKSLAEEGIVHSVARIGTFVGRPISANDGLYLLLLFRPETNTHCEPVQVGFEERIAELGGTCLTLNREVVVDLLARGDFPPLAGVFEFVEHHQYPRLWGEIELDIPCVEFGESLPGQKATHRVYFDDIGGGQQAAQHLINLGHQRIAFLGLHGTHDSANDFLWSSEREKGWSATMKQKGYETEGLVFRPRLTPHVGTPEQIFAAHEVARSLIGGSNASAVVAANLMAAQGLIKALNEVNIARELWPAIVCFDTDADRQLKAVHLTTLRLPWEDIGQGAADLLWAANHGQLEDHAQKRLVPMRLIKRLTSQANWAQHSTGIENQFAVMPMSASLG